MKAKNKLKLVKDLIEKWQSLIPWRLYEELISIFKKNGGPGKP